MAFPNVRRRFSWRTLLQVTEFDRLSIHLPFSPADRDGLVRIVTLGLVSAWLLRPISGFSVVIGMTVEIACLYTSCVTVLRTATM